jgi:hypothetical protein
VGKTSGADALAEMGDGLRVTEKVLKAHDLSLVHLRIELVRRTRCVCKLSLTLAAANGGLVQEDHRVNR